MVCNVLSNRIRNPFMAAATACLLFGGIAPGRTLADQVTLGASKDNCMYEDSGDFSNGAGDHFFAGNTNVGSARRGLVAFDLAGAGIPAGSTITSVTLRLYMSRTQAGNQTVLLYRVTTDWGEGTSMADGQEGGGTLATDGDATWLYTFYDTNDPGSSPAWASPGGDFAVPASASKTVGGTGTYTFGSTAAMVADVQAWLDNPATSFGWIVIGNEGPSQTAKRFDSRTNSNAGRRPLLTVNYTPPAIVGACCLGASSCQEVSPTNCIIQGGNYQGDGTSCDPNPCGVLEGACCFDDGMCTVLVEADCLSGGGSFQGNGTVCTPNPCPQPGACCFDDGTCSEILASECATQGGTYQAEGSTCTPGLCPVILEPFVDPLPVPALAQPVSGTPGGAASYDMAIRQFQQQLHRDLPPTTVWGFGDGPSNGVYPGPTILAKTGEPVTVHWINDLRDSGGNLLTVHHLPVDTCLHGAHDASPRTVIHLHGGHVPAASDGYPEATFLPGSSAVYTYPNNQLPGTLWYHDHALGITRLNVMMGLAGGYLITDDFEQALGLPAGAYEIPLIVQDRTFNLDGSFSYPATWQDHFFGDTILVNGKVWPYLNVDQGKYRFRIYNGSTSRAYTFSLSPATPFVQIGTEGGLLPAPQTLSEITLSPGERADVIVDFAGFQPNDEIILTNSAPAPFPGTPGVGVIPNIMKFVVQNQVGHTAAVPGALRPLSLIPQAEAVRSRDFELRKFSEPCAGSHWLINGLGWDDITEIPRLGTTEIWRFINRSGMSHPMHMHLVMFQVLDRQDFTVVGEEIVPVGSPVPPEANEAGWKDTVTCYPQQITRVIARFEDYSGLFAYHCHILEHEDHEMMRQFHSAFFGDTEPDGDVDLPDYGIYAECLSGPDAVPNPAPPTTVQECLDAFDTNFDGDVDLADFSRIQLAWGGG